MLEFQGDACYQHYTIDKPPVLTSVLKEYVNQVAWERTNISKLAIVGQLLDYNTQEPAAASGEHAQKFTFSRPLPLATTKFLVQVNFTNAWREIPSYDTIACVANDARLRGGQCLLGHAVEILVFHRCFHDGVGLCVPRGSRVKVSSRGREGAIWVLAPWAKILQVLEPCSMHGGKEHRVCRAIPGTGP